MPFAQKLLLNIPPLFLGIIIVGFAVVFSICGILIIRRFISHEKLKIHNDVAGFIFGTLGVTYAVLLAFTVIIVWENYDEASANVEKEANCLADLYVDAEAFGDPFKKEVQTLLYEYGKAVANEEWETLSRGEISPHVQQIVKNIWAHYKSYLPKNLTEEVFFKESVSHLNELGELRRLRLMESHTGINPILWFVLIFGGTITIVFTFFFGMQNLKAQLIMTTLLAIIISLILFTILEFDYPFTGNASISSGPFKELLVFKDTN